MRKNSKSTRKSISPNKKTSKKKSICSQCIKKSFNPINIQNSLYNKYSATQVKYHKIYLMDGLLKKNSSHNQQEINEQNIQHMNKYHNKLSIKHTFPGIKQVYKLHKQIPRIFHIGIRQIFNKCYHRKRLLQYFKIAKVLGIKVQSVRFSTFLLSTNQTRKKIDKSFDPIISKISCYEFSQEIQKKLLQEMQGKQNNHMMSNQKSYQKNSSSTFLS